MIKEQIPDYKDRVFYICGPPGMNAALNKELKALGMPDEKIRLEDFTGYE
jgi:ferredoxin-NADP reductase